MVGSPFVSTKSAALIENYSWKAFTLHSRTAQWLLRPPVCDESDRRGAASGAWYKSSKHTFACARHKSVPNIAPKYSENSWKIAERVGGTVFINRD